MVRGLHLPFGTQVVGGCRDDRTLSQSSGELRTAEKTRRHQARPVYDQADELPVGHLEAHIGGTSG